MLPMAVGFVATGKRLDACDRDDLVPAHEHARRAG